MRPRSALVRPARTLVGLIATITAAALVPMTAVGAAASAQRPIKFEIRGTAKQATILYNVDGQGTRKSGVVDLPWTTRFDAGDGRYVLSVVAGPGGGEVHCSVSTDTVARPVSSADDTTVACIVDRKGAVDTFTLNPPGTAASVSPLDAATTRYPKVALPAGGQFERLTADGTTVVWLDSPTSVRVFTAPERSRTIAAPADTKLVDAALVGRRVYALDDEDRLLAAPLDGTRLAPVAKVPGARTIYATAKEVLVFTTTDGQHLERFDAATGKGLGTLPGLHEVHSWSATRIVAEARVDDGYDVVMLDAATMRDVGRYRSDGIPSVTLIGQNEVLIRTARDVITYDMATKKRTVLPRGEVLNVFGASSPADATSATFTHTKGGGLGLWMAGSRRVLELDGGPDGASVVSRGTLWAWEREGLVRIDVATLRAGLTARGEK